MIGKRLINTGVAAADALVPSENFNTVLYTGNGSTQRIGGYINRGAEFNGSSSISTNLNLDTSSVFSWSCWINISDKRSTNFISEILTTTLAASPFNGVTLAIDSPNLVLMAGGSSRGTIISNPNLRQWYHIVITYNGSGTIKCYVDNGTPVTISYTLAQGGTLGIGDGPVSSWYGYIGKIDQVRIFDKELSSSEVTTLYGETHASTTISTTDIFNDDSGVALYQLDGNANDTGGVSGKFGSAAIFNGSSSKISYTDPIGSGNNDLSYSFWLNSNGFSSGYQTILGTDSNVAPPFKLTMRYDSTNSYKIYAERSYSNLIYYTSSSGSGYTASTINSNTWYHIVATYDASDSRRVKIYLNGSLVDDKNLSSSTGETTSTLQALGQWRNNNLQSFDGKIDDVRIYSDVLTSTEIGYIYNNTTASIPTDNLVAYYKLDGDARDEQQLYDGTATNVTYAYDGTATNITYQEATSFTPDLIWIKSRSETGHHSLFDSVRGIYKYLTPNQTGAEIDRTSNSAGVTAFDSNGFSVNDPGGAGENYYVNQDNVTYAAWCFKGGGTAVNNTDGTITSSVSANQDAGFSIVKYTGTGSNTNFGHGLSQAPELTIIKNLDDGTRDWIVHPSSQGNDKYLILNGTNAINTSSIRIQSVNSTVVNIGTNTEVNANGQDFICYNFHSVDGYSKIGSYTGNFSASGPIVETGFEPQFVMIKRTDGTAGNWFIFDNERSTTNERDDFLHPNLNAAETTNSSAYSVDFLSNGFQIKGNGDQINGNNGTHIYLAIAADPDTTTPTVEDSFDVVTYTGTGSTLSIETDFKPDLIWQKSRSVANHHVLTDSVRGIHSQIFSQTTDAASTSTTRVQSFDEGGFTIGNDSRTNTSGVDYVAWCWKAGDHDDNLPQINTEGSIDSVVSVNAEAGFSIVKYTGNGTSGSTIGHGLSSTPQMMISKRTDSGDNWNVYTEATGNTGILYLNLTDAFTTVSNRFNNTSPTSTVFTVGNSPAINVSGGEYIAYCFHSVSGYQKIGSYTGGTANQVITTGFKPRFILIKGIDSATADHWVIYDTVRSPSNPMDELLLPNLNDAENVNNTNHQISSENNGFKLITTSTQTNASGGDYIYLAIK